MFTKAVKWMFDARSPLYVKPRLDPELVAWAWRFMRSCDERVMRRAMPLLRDLLTESLDLYGELNARQGFDFQLTRRGLLSVFRTADGKLSAEQEVELSREVGVDAKLLDGDGLLAIDPHVRFRATGGVYFPGDAHLVPAILVKNLADTLSRSGVTILKGREVTGFATSNHRITAVRTSGGDLRSDEFVVAAGSWSHLLLRDLGIRMLLQAGKGYSITVKSPPVKPSVPCIFMERRVAVTPFAEALRFAGTMEIAGVDLSITQKRVEAILDAIPLYYADVERPDSAKAEIWKGLRPVSPDGMPYIGRFARYTNLIAATGHAMIGISLATVTGKLVAEIAQGVKPSHDLTLLSPDRFK
jgi:D-amino-acid dehydrogenase